MPWLGGYAWLRIRSAQPPCYVDFHSEAHPIVDQLGQVKNILRDTLNIGHRADKLTMDSPLMGSIPEFDSMAVVQVIAMMEERCGITVEDDELSADVFATVGSLTRFLATKTSA